MKLYNCINCGYNGDFGFYRARNIKCEICGSDGYLTELNEKEYKEWRKTYGKFQDECPFYKSKGKLNAMGNPFLSKEEKERKARQVGNEDKS